MGRVKEMAMDICEDLSVNLGRQPTHEEMVREWDRRMKCGCKCPTEPVHISQLCDACKKEFEKWSKDVDDSDIEIFYYPKE